MELVTKLNTTAFSLFGAAEKLALAPTMLLQTFSLCMHTTQTNEDNRVVLVSIITINGTTASYLQ